MTGLYNLPVRLYGPRLGRHLTTMSLFCSVCLKFVDVAVCSASAGSEWRGRNRLLLCFSCCDEDHAIAFLKRASLMVVWFMKYLTRVSTKEQKCSFGFRMYVRHRGAIVWKAVCMIWPIRNGAQRLPCLPGICITISGIHCYLL